MVTDDERSGRFGPRRWAWVVLIAVVLALTWRPVAKFRTHTFGPFDLTTQSKSLTRISDEHVPSNRLLSDPAFQMHPWALFAADELREGRAPLWNPFNGCGAPLLANYQSALLSPFTWPFYVLPFKVAVLASAWLKLLVTGLFAWLFFEKIGCTRGAAVLGAAALSASGISLLLLQHPHSGVFACLPAALYFTECVLRGESTRAARRASAGLALALGCAALAGHPETLLYVALLVAAYAAFGWWTSVLRRSRLEPRVPFGSRTALPLVTACLTALAIGAAQLVPFFEYLSHSAVTSIERDSGSGLGRENWPLFLFPNLAGTPMESSLGRLDLPRPNYQELTTFFVAGAAMLCAMFALPRLRSDGPTRFFGAVVMFWIVYAFDFGGVASWLAANTPLRSVPVHRTHPMWTMSVCALAAIGASRLELERGAKIARRVAVVSLSAVCMYAVFRWGAGRYLDFLSFELDTPRAELPEHIGRHIAWISACFGLATIGCVLLASSASRGLQLCGWSALIGASVLTSAVSIADYVPTVEDRFVFPRTSSMSALQQLVGDERALLLSVDGLAPELNVHYGVRDIGSYDAIGVADTVRLSDHFFGGDLARASPRRATRRALELFGVSVVATTGPWVAIGTDLGDAFAPRFDSSEYLADQFSGSDPRPFQRQRGASARFELVATRARFDGFALQLVGPLQGGTGEVHYTLVDIESGEEVTRGSSRIADLPRTPDAAWELSARFDERNMSAGRRYALDIDIRDVDEAVRPRVARRRWTERESTEGESAQRENGERESHTPEPKIDLGYGQNDFEPIGRAGRHYVSRFRPSLGRVWMVGRARGAATHAEAFEWVTAPEFEPLSEVVLEGLEVQPSSGQGPFTLRRLAESATNQRFFVSGETAGWLVLAQTFYPGWRASIDGVETRILRANYAFSAVGLPPGEHEIEVWYEPASFRWGVGLTVFGLAAALALSVWSASLFARADR